MSIISGLASIVIPCWNQLEFTRQCIAALKNHPRRPWELIAVDNGSTDHTDIYFAGVADAASVPVTVITNCTNRGFPAAINQGLKAARGEYLVLLKNDVVVTDGWLEQLIGLLNAKRGSTAEGAERNTESEKSVRFVGESNHAMREQTIPEGCSGARVVGGLSEAPVVPRSQTLATTHGIGLVGPMSNYAAPPQLVENVPCRDLPAMHEFARRWRDDHRGKWFTTPKLSGFCLLMKRAVYEEIGGLDERFGLGFFDDDDYCKRARQAGFEQAVAHDSFVHHFGSRTFRGNGVDAEKLLDENARRFADKWGSGKANGTQVVLRPWTQTKPQCAPEGRGDEEDLTQSRKAAKNANGNSSSLNDDGQGWARADASMSEPCSLQPNSASSFASLRFCVSSSSSNDWAGDRARVSLTMIVRDEEQNLANCLESVRGLFDAIVIVDTGSVDRTKEIAREFGARVFDFTWIDDFAAARNEALAHATGDYAFWLDADDVVDPPEREKLGVLFDRLSIPSRASGAGAARSEPRTPMRRLLPIAALGSPDVSREGEPPCEPAFTRANELQARSEPRTPDSGAAADVVRCRCASGPKGHAQRASTCVP